MAEAQKTYITPESKAALERELKALIDNRPVIAAEINERREAVSYTHLTLPTIYSV